MKTLIAIAAALTMFMATAHEANNQTEVLASNTVYTCMEWTDCVLTVNDKDIPVAFMENHTVRHLRGYREVEQGVYRWKVETVTITQVTHREHPAAD